ncbi:MAG: hypothetical protein ABI946_01835 [Chthoniobacterales bacterium]
MEKHQPARCCRDAVQSTRRQPGFAAFVGSDLGAKLHELFDWLNNPDADRAVPDTDSFYGFRYLNGGLFSERLGFPRFSRATRDALLFCCDFQ